MDKQTSKDYLAAVLDAHGIEVIEGRDYVQYHNPYQDLPLPFPLTLYYDTNWAVLRAIIDDAERRAKERSGPCGGTSSHSGSTGEMT